MNIDKKEFKVILEKLEPAVLKSSEAPILSNILITKESAQSFNSQLGCHVSTEIFSEIPYSICIPFIKTKTFINGAPNEQVKFEIKDSNIELRSGRSSAKIPFQSADDFPDFTELIEKYILNGFEVTNDLSEGLKICSLFTCKQLNRGTIHGVNLQSNSIKASDGKRIAQYTLEQEYPEVNIVIQADLIKALKGSDYLYFDKDKIVIGKEDTIYFSPLIKGDYPQVEKYFPKIKSYIKLPIEEMRKALKKVGDFSEEGTELARCSIKFDNGIEIKYEGQTAHVKEFFDFGGKIQSKGFKLNPYHFEKILLYCDKFSFITVNDFDILFGGTEDNKFKCIMSLEKI